MVHAHGLGQFVHRVHAVCGENAGFQVGREGGVVEKSLVRFVGNRGLEEVELCLHGGYLSLLQGGKGGAVT